MLDYHAATDAFQQAARARNAQLDSLPLATRGPQNEPLAIHIAWLGSSNPQRAVLHFSGVHGVEAAAGSAVQRAWLEAGPTIPDGIAVVLIHGFNPYGWLWRRRANADNVDLNRNCLPEGAEFAGVPDTYRDLQKFLNPCRRPSRGLGFLLQATREVVRFGLPQVTQAIAGGQYEYPRGLFFGGTGWQEEPRCVIAWLSQRLPDLRRAAAIDVHTGLGRFGRQLLLVDEHDADPRCQELRRQFGPTVRGWGSRHGYYQARGKFITALATTFEQVDWITVTQEFGTYSLLRVFAALRYENWQWHFQKEKRPFETLRPIFVPDNPAWQLNLVAQGTTLLQQMIEHIAG